MIYRYEDKKPKISSDAFVAESADLIGEVVLEEDSNIWFGAVLRADVNKIIVKKGLIFKIIALFMWIKIIQYT